MLGGKTVEQREACNMRRKGSSVGQRGQRKQRRGTVSVALLRHCERLCCIEAFVRQTRFASWGAVRIHRRLDRCRNESHSLDSTPVARFGPTFSVTQLSL